MVTDSPFGTWTSPITYVHVCVSLAVCVFSVLSVRVFSYPLIILYKTTHTGIFSAAARRPLQREVWVSVRCTSILAVAIFCGLKGGHKRGVATLFVSMTPMRGLAVRGELSMSHQKK
eukprot:4702108-Ditylum_brightwellii.AAC.1